MSACRAAGRTSRIAREETQGSKIEGGDRDEYKGCDVQVVLSGMTRM